MPQNKSDNSIFFSTLLWLIASNLINLLATRPLLDKTNATDFKERSRFKAIPAGYRRTVDDSIKVNGI